VSELAKSLDAAVEQSRSRPLDPGPYRFVQADAMTVRVREGGRTVIVHALIAAGAGAGGKREIPGFDVTSGDGAGWLAFSRGLSGVVPVTGDAHPGLAAAIAAALPGATWQRCRTHYLRDLLTKLTKASQPWVATLVRTIFDQPDPAEAHAQSARVVSALEARLPAAAEHLAAARDGLLAFTAVPREIWRQVWPPSPQQRLNRELRRRTGVAGIFPGRAAIIRLAGAVLMEQNGERTEARRYLGPEVPAKIGTAAAPSPAAGTPEEVTAIEAISAQSQQRIITVPSPTP
jgi:putative transposase